MSKNFTQTSIHTYFKCVGTAHSSCFRDSTPCPCPLKKRKSSVKATTMRQVQTTPVKHVLGPLYDKEKMRQFQQNFGHKRKLPVAIYSDDENSEPEDSEETSFENFTQITLNTPAKKINGNDRRSSNSPLCDVTDSSRTQLFNNAEAPLKKETTKVLETKQNRTLEVRNYTQITEAESDGRLDMHEYYVGDSKKANYPLVNKVLDAIAVVRNSPNFFKLLLPQEIHLLNKFLKMEETDQQVCCKLFLWKMEWYSLTKVASKLKLEMNDKIDVMYRSLRDNNFIETDYMREGSTIDLLNSLSLSDIKNICHDLKIKMNGLTKPKLIEKLIEYSNKQVTLTVKKSSEQVLRDYIKQKKGECLKLNQMFYNCLYKIYLLNTFTYSQMFPMPQDYFSRIDFLNIEFADFPIENYDVFTSADDFLRYAEASKLRLEFEKAVQAKDWNSAMEVCKCASERLVQLSGEVGRCFRVSIKQPPFLERFTGFSKYASIVTSGSKLLTAKFPVDVRAWLDFLLTQNYCNSKRGFWVNQLLLILVKYVKDYEGAAKLFIDAFERFGDDLSPIQKQDLILRGKNLLKLRYKLPQSIKDQLLLHIPVCCDRDWPQIVINKKTMRQNESGYKRKYVHEFENGDKAYLSVEDTALQYYHHNGYPKGVHCEGTLIISSFILLFYDIIYETPVEGTFVSKTQNAPLDMYSEYFYKNREYLIRQRLSEIETGWSDDQILNVLITNYDLHAHKTLLHKIATYAQDPGELFSMLLCIGRPGLAKIYERLCVNYKDHHSGFPDLIVWDVTRKTSKFVEVKGEGDSLSTKQKLWLNALLDYGIQAEVCHVHSIGSKNKMGPATNPQEA